MIIPRIKNFLSTCTTGAKALSILIWAIIFSVLGICILFSLLIISLLCTDLNSYKNNVSAALNYVTQTEWDIAGSLEFNISGGPHISAFAVAVDLPDVLEQKATAQIRVGKIRIYIWLLPLLRNELVLRKIDLDNPILIITEKEPTLPVPPQEQSNTPENTQEAIAPASNASVGNISLNTSANKSTANTIPQVITEHDAVKEFLSHLDLPKISLNNGYLEWRNAKHQPYLLVRNLNTVLLPTPSPQYFLQADVEIASEQEALSVQLHTQMRQKSIQTHMDGTLSLTVYPILYPQYKNASTGAERQQAVANNGLTLKTDWKMHWENQLQKISLHELTITGEECAATGEFALNVPLTAAASLQGNNTMPWGEGNLIVQQLSLPRWIESLRSITRPIRYQLHTLTAQSRIIVANNTVELADLAVSLAAVDAFGTGAVAAPKGFSLDVRTAFVDIADIFPPKEKRKDIPQFTASQIAFITGPSTDSPTPIDITLHADAVTYKKIIGEDLTLHLYPPARNSVLQLDLPIRSIAGGTADLKAIFEKGGQYGTIHLKNIQLQELYFVQFTDISTQGTLFGTAEFRNLEKNPLSIPLENLHTFAGQLQVDKGVCTIGSNLPYRASKTIFTLNGLIGLTANTEELLLVAAHPGKKNTAKISTGHALASGLSLQSIDIVLEASTAATTQNMIWYPEEDTLISTAIPVQLSAEGPSEYPNHTGIWKGESSFKVTTGEKAAEVSLTDTKAHFFDMLLEGSFVGKNIFSGTQAPQITGDFSLSSKIFRQSLGKLGYLLEDIPDSCLNSLSLKGNMLLQESVFSIKNSQIHINQASIAPSSLSGDFLYNQGWKKTTTRPKANFTLSADSIDFDAYFPKTPTGETAKSEAWHLAALEDIDLHGSLTLGKVTYWDFPFTDVNTTVELDKGKLNLYPLSAKLYGGGVSGSFSGHVVHPNNTKNLALDIALGLSGNDIPLEPVVTTLTKGPYLKGPAQIQINITGRVHKSADIPGLLNGSVQVHAKKGQLRTSEKGNPTQFSHFFISGLIKQGVFYSDDLKITSPLMDITGKGWIDLDKEKIDYTAIAVVIKGPTIPIRFHGDLKSPKSSMNPVGIIAETAGTITMGIYDVLEGIITLPFTIFNSGNKTEEKKSSPSEQRKEPLKPRIATDSPYAH